MVRYEKVEEKPLPQTVRTATIKKENDAVVVSNIDDIVNVCMALSCDTRVKFLKMMDDQTLLSRLSNNLGLEIHNILYHIRQMHKLNNVDNIILRKRPVYAMRIYSRRFDYIIIDLTK